MSILLDAQVHLYTAQVPAFKWHIIDGGVSFEIEGTGVQVLPFCGM